jgi:hypothetical protein
MRLQDCFLSNHLCRTQKPGRQVMRSRGEADHTDRCALCERMPRALSADCPQCNARGTDGRADRLLSSITARPCGRSKTDRDALHPREGRELFVGRTRRGLHSMDRVHEYTVCTECARMRTDGQTVA